MKKRRGGNGGRRNTGRIKRRGRRRETGGGETLRSNERGCLSHHLVEVVAAPDKHPCVESVDCALPLFVHRKGLDPRGCELSPDVLVHRPDLVDG